jgi:serine/threonine-protein kinase HipA
MSRSFLVSLNDTAVGHLSEEEDGGRVSFRFLKDYKELSSRPVLSQSFEDDLERPYRGKRGELPSFFANLVPEGPLRALIESNLQIAPGDDLALLAAVGQDLPGAVALSPDPGEPGDLGDEERENQTEVTRGGEADEPALRFSLAGVQLKFSVLREAEKLTLPVHGRLGEWIAKLDSSRFPNVVENEVATLEWARAAGFDVPECHLQSVSSLAPPLHGYAHPDSSVLVIRRYDREGGRRVHQEDFAQVVSQPPRLKYDHISYEQCAALSLKIVGEDAYLEFVRRLAFVVASGNTDAHLKNWSLIYPDAVNARLSPLYDQVATICWDEMPRVLALNLRGRKSLLEVDEKGFASLAKKAGADVGETLSAVQGALQRIAEAWAVSGAGQIMPPKHIAALRGYWVDAPLLKRFSDLIR